MCGKFTFIGFRVRVRNSTKSGPRGYVIYSSRAVAVDVAQGIFTRLNH